MSFAARLHPASWRGVPFALEEGAVTVGRRKIQHAYPYRDSVWFEDQGKLPRTFRIAGFLIGDSAVYGGGDVIAQCDRMTAAAEAKGPGILVHPTRGRITVDLIDLAIVERSEDGNYAELSFTFAQGGEQLFPAVLGAAGDLLGKVAGLADLAHLGDFVSGVTSPLRQGLAAATSIATTAGDWIDKARSLSADATSLFGTVSQLGGADFGRYFNGRNAGFLKGLVSPYAGARDVEDLIALGASQRATVSSAAAAVQTALSGLGVRAAPADVGGAIQAHVEALRATAADPADAIRILSNLTTFRPASPAARTPVGIAASNLYRRAAATGLARASATYAPASSDDAHAVRDAVLAPIEQEIELAGDSGADDVFRSLRDLRKAVVEDLGARGAALVGLTAISLPAPVPAVVVAAQRYGDAGRGAELVTQADPIHPWFMPARFKALAV